MALVALSISAARAGIGTLSKMKMLRSFFLRITNAVVESKQWPSERASTGELRKGA